MSLMPKGHPCTKDCTDRSATCRLDCEKFKKYMEKQEVIRKAKERERMLDDYEAKAIIRRGK